MSYTNGLDNPELYFQAKLYTGTGSSQSITFDGSENMQPDWIWIKSRSNAHGHNVADSVRGISNGGTKILVPDSTQAEETNASGQGIQTADSDGFTLGSETNTSGSTNGSSKTYVSWNWKAGGSASSNSNGSITSSVSANTTAGFSIVSYTGAGGSSNVGHGLGVAPNFIIAKNRDSGSLSWFVSNDAIGWTKRLKLDGSNTAATNVAFGDTDPDSTKFYLQDNNINTSGQDHIAYCFAEKQGYSKIGSYTGNGNADGPFIYTGFKPAWVIVKNTGASENWIIFDNKRPGYNLTDALLKPSLNNAESTSGVKFDLLSNGFKARVSDAEGNSSSGSFIYMAFAESPFVNSNGVPCNAR